MSGPVLDFDPQAANRIGVGDTREAPDVIETIGAAFGAQRADTTGYAEQRQVDAYKPIIDTLLELQPDRDFTAYINPATGVVSTDGVWRDVRRFRRERGLFDGLPDTVEDFERKWRGVERQRIERLEETAVRGNGAIAFAGGVAGAMTDPVNIMTLPVGGGGRTIAAKIITEGLVNAGVEAAMLPTVAKQREELGRRQMTPIEAALDVAMAGVGGAAIRGGIEFAPKIDGKLYSIARPIREAIDGKFADQDLARAFSRIVPEHVRTPEQEAALQILARETELDQSSPFVNTYQAVDAHREKLARATARLIEGRMPAAEEIAAAGVIAEAPEAITAVRISAGLAGDRASVAGVLEDGGLPQPVVAGFLGNFEVEGGYGGALGDSGTASGIAQWRHSRRANFVRMFKKDPHLATKAEQAQFVLWEMRNPGEAGMTPKQRDRILAAQTPEEAAELIDKYYERSSGAHTERRKAEARRIFGDGDRPAEISWTDEAPVNQVRPDALDAERPRVAVDGRAVPVAEFLADDIGVDAELMQFKGGGDEFGVTERLHGIDQWDPIAAGMVTVWEAADGRRLIADGHQRLGLAKRIQAQGGGPIAVNAFVLREADGFSAVDARIITALKNIGEGTGTATDAAKVFRDVGLDAQEIARRLPPRSALVRDGKSLARLDDEAFGAVVNEVIPEPYGAAIGALVEDPRLHMAMVRILNETSPPNRTQAEAIIRQAREAGFTSETQDSLFGSEELVTGLFAQRAKILDRALKELRKMKSAFQVAVRNADTLEAGGNRIDVDASGSAADGNARALALVDKLALRKGNAVNELLDQAARRLAAGEPIARVLKDFVAAVQKLDLEDIAREAGSAGRLGDGPGGSGRTGELEGQASFEDAELTPREADAAIAAGESGPSLFDDATAARFDDPAGEGVRETADSVWHDIEAQDDFAAPTAEQARKELELKTEGRQKGTATQKAPGEDGGLFDTQDTTGDLFDLEDGKGARSASDILAELDGERAGLEEIRKCL